MDSKEAISMITLKAMSGFRNILDLHHIDNSPGSIEHSILNKIESNLIEEIEELIRG